MLHHAFENRSIMTVRPTSSLVLAPLSDAERWAQVARRDRTADGTFVYAVTSTGVFCRPSCPSRRPRPERVCFFDTPSAAARAGFRPCLRCRPLDALHDSVDPAVARVAAYVKAHADESLPLARLAGVAGCSPTRLQRQFTRALGLSPRAYQAACRADRFRAGLQAGHDVTTATYEAGYGSPSRVYDSAPTGRGVPPHVYRRGGDGERIGYVVVDTSLGPLLVAATHKGVCAVKLGDDRAWLIQELEREFPAATMTADTNVPPEWVTAVVARVLDAEHGGASALTRVPLDVRGTAFQWRVWRALERIPRGETRTYAEVAAAIGAPAASRAVARACASNRVALVVPCHRVVPRAGGTGGYRWGVARKRSLLAREAETTRNRK